MVANRSRLAVVVFAAGLAASYGAQRAMATNATAQPVEGVSYSCTERLPWSTPAALSSNFMCSGHGTCQANGSCVCQDGWTGRSDFVNTEHLDCQIHFTSVLALWGALMFLAVWGQISMWDQIMEKWEKFKELRATRHRAGMKLKYTDHPGLMAVICFTYVGCPAILAMGMLKFFIPSARIGVSLAPTLLFALVRTAFYVMLYFYQPALLATFLVSSRRRHAEAQFLVKMTRWLAKLNLCVAIFASLMPLITVMDGGKPNQLAVAVYRTYMWSLVFAVVLHIGQALAVYFKAKTILLSSSGLGATDLMRETRKKMLKGEMKGVIHGSIQCILYLVFAVEPFFYNKHDYFNPIGWATYVLMAREIAQSAIAQQSRKSTAASALSSSSSADLDQSSGFKSSLRTISGRGFSLRSKDSGRILQTLTAHQPRVQKGDPGPEDEAIKAGSKGAAPQTSDLKAATSVSARFQQSIAGFSASTRRGNQDRGDGSRI